MTSEPYGFRVLDHSGDLGIRAWGRDEMEALAHASNGLVAQVCHPGSILPRESLDVTIPEEDGDRRIVAFLNEIIYLIYTKSWLPASVSRMTVCSSKGCAKLHVTLLGEPLDPARHVFKYDIKAVTFHNFCVERQSARVTISFVCDL